MAVGEIASEYRELDNGDHMRRPEFHRIYEQMPENVRAELIGGIVYVASPLKRSHGTPHVFLSTILGNYAIATPGVEPGDNTSLLLGEDSEPQPDLLLRVLPECGGQSTVENDYLVGPPELVIEVANTSRTIDLHRKRIDYEKYGVREYIVLSVRDARFFWMDLANGHELETDDEVIRSITFPGLWIDCAGVLAGDDRIRSTLDAGLTTTEHERFVEQLAAQRSAD